MAHRLSAPAQAELDDIWDYIARETGSADLAERQVNVITDRSYLLAGWPRIGRARDDLRPGLRSYPAGEYVIIYRVDGEDVVILHVFHGRRDIDALLGP
jgi:toxin ParE1/3/4